MPGGGTSIFTDLHSYLARLPLSASCALTEGTRFSARLTWVELPDTHLFRAREAAPRVGYLVMPAGVRLHHLPDAESVAADGRRRGATLGELMFHALGGRFHQRTSSLGHWGGISLKPSTLASVVRTLTGRTVAVPELCSNLSAARLGSERAAPALWRSMPHCRDRGRQSGAPRGRPRPGS